MNILPPHLGGSEGETHIDQGALQFIVNATSGMGGVRSMLDVGCGPGGMVDLARKLGIQSFGVDGDTTINRGTLPVFIHDFTTGPVPLKRTFDLCWSVEFVEHVEEKYMDNFIQAFQACRFLMMTYAYPGQGGHHHVNEQDTPYWIDKMTQAGFIFEPQMTDGIRRASTMKQRYIRQHGLFFKNGRI